MRNIDEVTSFSVMKSKEKFVCAGNLLNVQQFDNIYAQNPMKYDRDLNFSSFSFPVCVLPVYELDNDLKCE